MASEFVIAPKSPTAPGWREVRIGARSYRAPSQLPAAQLRGLYTSGGYSAVEARIRSTDVLPRYRTAAPASAPMRYVQLEVPGIPSSQAEANALARGAPPSSTVFKEKPMFGIPSNFSSIVAPTKKATNGGGLLSGISDALSSVTKTIGQAAGIAGQVEQVRAAIRGKPTAQPAAYSGERTLTGGPTGTPAGGSGLAFDLYTGALEHTGGPLPGILPMLFGARPGKGGWGSVLPSASAGASPGDVPCGGWKHWIRVIAPGLLRPNAPIPKGLRVSVVDGTGDVVGWVAADVAIPQRALIVYESAMANVEALMVAASAKLKPAGYVRVAIGSEDSTTGVVIRGPRKRRLHGTDRAIRDYGRNKKKVQRAKTIVNRLIPSPKRR